MKRMIRWLLVPALMATGWILSSTQSADAHPRVFRRPVARVATAPARAVLGHPHYVAPRHYYGPPAYVHPRAVYRGWGVGVYGGRHGHVVAPGVHVAW